MKGYIMKVNLSNQCYYTINLYHKCEYLFGLHCRIKFLNQKLREKKMRKGTRHYKQIGQFLE